jgi:RNA methyltransferase, TrmH family
MLSANRQKFLLSLHTKKHRQKYRNFLVEGTKMVSELLQQTRFPVVAVYATELWASANPTDVSRLGERFVPVLDSDLKKVGTLVTPNQVLAVAAYLDQAPQWPDSPGWLLYLDGLQDPGNMGSILRIADWFGWQGVVASPDTVNAFSPKVIQAGMGACLRVPVYEDVPLHILRTQLPDRPVWGALMEGQALWAAQPPESGILVIGNEGRGIRPEQLPLIDQAITIPRGAGGQAESLNAAVAAGILVAGMSRGK